VIFHDATLRAIAERAPKNLDDLKGISGIGEKKLAAYGTDVLQACAEPTRLARLKAWRAGVAKAHNLPPFVVLHDATLRAIAERVPKSLDDLKGISGIGEKKLAAYGTDVLQACAEPVRGAPEPSIPDDRDMGRKSFEIFDEHQSPSPRGKGGMCELYDALPTDDDGSDVYLGDGLWLSSDGSCHDWGR
jgi:ribonuclease D